MKSVQIITVGKFEWIRNIKNLRTIFESQGVGSLTQTAAGPMSAFLVGSGGNVWKWNIRGTGWNRNNGEEEAVWKRKRVLARKREESDREMGGILQSRGKKEGFTWTKGTHI